MSNDSFPAVHFRTATTADRPRLIAMINAAFAVETFLEGARTDEERLAAMMHKGEILLAEDRAGENRRFDLRGAARHTWLPRHARC